MFPESTNTVVTEIATGSKDPTSLAVKAGRGFLYDAKLSGNGSGSCASCHIDGESDHLTWDLGDPTGSMFPVTLNTGAAFEEHPMKGPMNTLTMRGLANEQPYHWRGDKPEFSAFNAAFQGLMGGTQISSEYMTAFTNFADTITWMPNPNQNLDRTYPTSLQGGNAQLGEVQFATTGGMVQGTSCNSCHTASNFGSNKALFLLPNGVQPFKSTLLRATYQKELFNKSGPSIDGFGILHDGSEQNIHSFLAGTFFPSLKGKTATQNNIAAFNLAIDTGTAPAVGFAFTLTAADAGNSLITTEWSTLESQAAAQNADLIAQGTVNGVVSGLLYSPTTNLYTQQQTGTTYSHAQILAFVNTGDTLTVMGVPLGSGSRIAALAKRRAK